MIVEVRMSDPGARIQRERHAAKLASLAGLLGATAALCGKLTFDKSASVSLVSRVGIPRVTDPPAANVLACWVVRFLAGLGFAAATVNMETIFSRALDAASSSLVPTVVSVSTNFLVSVCCFCFSSSSKPSFDVLFFHLSLLFRVLWASYSWESMCKCYGGVLELC